jgi:hypothetical protein
MTGRKCVQHEWITSASTNTDEFGYLTAYTFCSRCQMRRWSEPGIVIHGSLSGKPKPCGDCGLGPEAPRHNDEALTPFSRPHKYRPMTARDLQRIKKAQK